MPRTFRCFVRRGEFHDIQDAARLAVHNYECAVLVVNDLGVPTEGLASLADIRNGHSVGGSRDAAKCQRHQDDGDTEDSGRQPETQRASCFGHSVDLFGNLSDWATRTCSVLATATD